MWNNLIFFLTFTWAVIKGSTKASLLEILLKRLNKVNPVIEYVAPAPTTNQKGPTVDYLQEKRKFEAPLRKMHPETMEGHERYIWLN